MEIASLVTLIINTLLTGVLGVAALLIARAAHRVSEELEEINDELDKDEAESS